MKQLKLWMQAATADQQNALAEAAGTSRAYLYHLSSEKETYARGASPELAAKIEAASLALHRETKGALPKVYRTDLNSACRECDFARKCLGSAAVVSQFDILGD